MSLKDEMKLNKGFSGPGEEALLSVILTAELWKKRSFAPRLFGITPAQYNVLSLLYSQCKPGEGLTQAQISEMMVVNPANTTPLIDRMEAMGYVERVSIPKDRRFWLVKILPKGVELFKRANKIYAARVKHITGRLTPDEERVLIAALEKIRQRIRDFDADAIFDELFGADSQTAAAESR